MNAANSEIRRLAYIRHAVVTISLAELSWMGGMVGVSPGMADWLRVSGGLLVGVRLEIQMDVDDKRRADGRKQAGLREQVRRWTR